MTQNQPFAVPNFLAGTPAKPKYAVSVTRQNGESLELVDPNITRALVALMDMNAVLGGAASHFGGPSAFAELMSALFGIVFAESEKKNRPWYDLFHIINDAGHCENGLYALKANYGFAGLTIESLKKFRSIESVLTGHGESHLFPQGVYLSNGPLGSSLPQAQGLAMADALAGKDRITVTAISDGACMEGEAKEALAAIPGFAAKRKLAPFVLIVSDNNTKLSGRIDKDAFSLAPTFDSLEDLGWRVLNLKDGHDLAGCVNTIDQALQLARDGRPVAVHAKTIKGKGVKKTMDSSSGGHGFPLKAASELGPFLQEIMSRKDLPQELQSWLHELEASAEKKNSEAKPPPTVKSEKIQTGVAQAMIKARQRGLPVVSITSDLPGSTGVSEFHKAFPEASFDVGVAEANMVSAAAGFSKTGFIPFVDTFAQFGVTKGALPLIMASLSEAPVIAVFSHTGFQDAADGASHQALSYFAMTAAIPHVNVYALTCSQEAEALLTQAINEFAEARKTGKSPASSIFFLGRENFPQNYGVSQFELGRAQVLADAAEAQLAIVAAGSLVPEALIAQARLHSNGIEAIVINPSIINKPDTETIAKALQRAHNRLLTVEDHQVIGGMGAQLVHALSASGHCPKVRSLGVRDKFGQSAYLASQLYEKHGLNATAIEAAARELVRTV